MNILNGKLEENRILLFDGAIGTNLQSLGLPKGYPPEQWNIENPEKVKQVHRSFAEAGVDFITSNTFGGNRLKLGDYGLEDKIEMINTKAIEIARDAANPAIAIAGSIGPTGALVQPLGILEFDDAYRVFLQQAKILKKAGADLLILETFTDIAELRAAALAASESGLPFIANMSLDDDGRAVTGTSAAAFAITMSHLGPIALGVNCGKTPNDYPDAITQIAEHSHLPILAEPNAGIPCIQNGCTVFPASPDDSARIALRNIKAGARFVGGCCGTTPEHIRSIAKSIQSIEKPTERSAKYFEISSRTDYARFGDGRIRIIGERINPAGKKKLKAQLRDGKLTRLRHEGLRQESANADAIDVNISVPKMEEHPLLKRAVRNLGNILKIPIFIDSADRDALEPAFMEYHGRAVLNSITAKKNDLDELLPLIAKYGANFVALPLDEDGIPKNAAGRLYLAKNILKRANEFGIDKSRILFDVLILPIGSNSKYGKIAMETLALYRDEGFYTTAGVSNISYGLPARERLNAAFLEHLIAGGIDSAIADPTANLTSEIVHASNLIRGKDDNSKEYIEFFANFKKSDDENNIETTLFDDIQRGEKESAQKKLENLLNDMPALDIVNKKLIPAIRQVGDKFEKKEVFLPVVISAAETVKFCMDFLEPHLKENRKNKKAKIILATVEGDIHDIGKNLVATVLSSYGFLIIDLGKSIGADRIMDAIADEKPDGIGLSALMTTTMPAMENICKKVKQKYPDLPIVIGGACVDSDFAEKIGANTYAKDAIDAANKFGNLI
ncbi:MAG: homocysteine S-methyltransferase family protein [Candidatus Zixiibacteriota bacterium]